MIGAGNTISFPRVLCGKQQILALVPELTKFETIYLLMSLFTVVIGYLDLTSLLSLDEGLVLLALCVVLLLMRRVVDK
jgi:hypothetical protein